MKYLHHIVILTERSQKRGSRINMHGTAKRLTPYQCGQVGCGWWIYKDNKMYEDGEILNVEGVDWPEVGPEEPKDVSFKASSNHKSRHQKSFFDLNRTIYITGWLHRRSRFPCSAMGLTFSDRGFSRKIRSLTTYSASRLFMKMSLEHGSLLLSWETVLLLYPGSGIVARTTDKQRP